MVPAFQPSTVKSRTISKAISGRITGASTHKTALHGLAAERTARVIGRCSPEIGKRRRNTVFQKPWSHSATASIPG
jgi:hypothetical protein